MTSTGNKLHWTQRVALVRHNLHTASRSGDFTFFKTLQAAGLLEGTNHVAALSAALGEDSDAVLAALDNLNSGLGYVHQDAFKNAYDKVKDVIREEKGDAKDVQSKLYVDIKMQKNMADLGIDKMTNSAVALIEAQPAGVQDEATNVWVTGITIVADCMEVSLQQLDALEANMSDFIRLEESWNTVKASVVSAVTGIKGVFLMMDPSAAPPEDPQPRPVSLTSASSAMFRRLSSAFQSPPSSRNPSNASSNSSGGMHMMAPPPPPSGRNGSVVSFGTPVYHTPTYVRSSVSSGCPTKMPTRLSNLAPIPATPLADDMDPFDTTPLALPNLPGQTPTLVRQVVM